MLSRCFGGRVNDNTVGSTTELKAIPRASQHAIHLIHRLPALIDFIVTNFKSYVWSGEEISSKRPGETRTALGCPLHTCERVPQLIARLDALFGVVLFAVWIVVVDSWHS